MEDTHKRKLTRKVIDTPNGDIVTGDLAMGPWAKGRPNVVVESGVLADFKEQANNITVHSECELWGEEDSGSRIIHCLDFILRRIIQFNAVLGLWCVRLKIRFDTNCPSCI